VVEHYNTQFNLDLSLSNQQKVRLIEYLEGIEIRQHAAGLEKTVNHGPTCAPVHAGDCDRESPNGRMAEDGWNSRDPHRVSLVWPLGRRPDSHPGLSDLGL
jgi:hypothetical protein